MVKVAPPLGTPVPEGVITVALDAPGVVAFAAGAVPVYWLPLGLPAVPLESGCVVLESGNGGDEDDSGEEDDEYMGVPVTPGDVTLAADIGTVEFGRGGTVNGTGLPETDPAGVEEVPELLKPPDPTVGPLMETADAVEFDKGYGAELLAVAPGVPPVGRAVPVTEAGLGRLMALAV